MIVDPDKCLRYYGICVKRQYVEAKAICWCQLRADMNTILNTGMFQNPRYYHEQIKQIFKDHQSKSNRPDSDSGKDTAG